MEGQDRSSLNLFHFFDLPREVRDLIYDDLLKLEPLSRNQLHTDNFVGYLDTPSQLCRQISIRFRTEVEDHVRWMGRLRLEEVVPHSLFHEQETPEALKQVRHVEIYMFPCEWATLDDWNSGPYDPEDRESSVHAFEYPLNIHCSARDFADVLQTMPRLTSVRIKMYMHETPNSPLWVSLGGSRSHQWPDKQREPENHEHLESARKQLQKLVKVPKLQQLEIFHSSGGLWKLNCTTKDCTAWENLECAGKHCMSWERSPSWTKLETQPDSTNKLCVTWKPNRGWEVADTMSEQVTDMTNDET